MAQESLKVKIGADVAQGVSGIKQFGREINSLPSSMGKVDSAVKKTSTNFTGLNRVIQDLPFGFVAISNNLEQLLPAAGAAGLGLSTLISVLTFASVGFANWTRGLGSASDKMKEQIAVTKDFKEALDNYVATLEDVTQARVKGDQDAQKELVNLKTLYDATQNQNIAIGKRKQLVDQLQEQYPKYFGNIKDEIILAGGARDAYNKLTTAIIDSARARAGQDQLIDIQKELIPLEEQYSNALQKQSDTYRELIRQRKLLSDAQKKAGTTDLAFGPSIVGVNDALRASNEAIADTKKLFDQIDERNKRAKKLTDVITATVEVDPDALLDSKGKLEKTKKKAEVKLREHPFLMPVEPVILGAPAKVAVEMGKNFEGHPVLLPVKPDLDKDALFADIAINLGAVRKAGSMFGEEMGSMFSDSFQARVQAAVASGLSTKDLEAFQNALKTTMVIGAQVADVLGNAFGAFGQALVNGQNALQAFFGSVKSALSQLIGQLLKTVAVAAILSAISGGAGAAGGFSFLGALKGLLGAAKPFAAGGLVSGPTLGLVGEGRTTSRSNPEVIAPLNQLKKFIGGGQQTQVFIPALHVGYDQWRISFNRANNNGRMFG